MNILANTFERGGRVVVYMLGLSAPKEIKGKRSALIQQLKHTTVHQPSSV